MRMRYTIYLTDTHATLYQGAREEITVSRENFDITRLRLTPYLPPKTSPISLIIDCHLVDIHEELLPPLPCWDYLRLFFHKKASIASQPGFSGLCFFKNGQDFILRWAHFNQGNPLYLWIEWVIKGAGQIFFAAFQAAPYLYKYSSNPKNPFHLLLYPLPSKGWRIYVYKGKQFLLARHLRSENEISPILHFLNRTFPEIQEKLEILKLDNPLDFISFILAQKRPTFLLKPINSSKIFLKKLGLYLFPLMMMCWVSFESYELCWLKRQSTLHLAQTKFLKRSSLILKASLPSSKKLLPLTDLQEYLLIKKFIKAPLADLRDISSLLKKYSLHLERISWHFENNVELSLTFFITRISPYETLDAFFDALLLSLQHQFKKAKICVLTAPYNSNPQEVFKSSDLTSHPSATLKICFP